MNSNSLIVLNVTISCVFLMPLTYPFKHLILPGHKDLEVSGKPMPRTGSVPQPSSCPPPHPDFQWPQDESVMLLKVYFLHGMKSVNQTTANLLVV